jgi:hypothetical protein
MKTSLAIIFFCFTTLCNSQALFIGFQPADVGIVVRGDYYIGQFGFYSSASYGNWGLYRYVNLQHHFKLTQGIMIPLADYEGWRFNITAGLNYHIVNSDNVLCPPLNPIILEHFSFELGLSIYTDRRIAIGMRTDIRRWEPCVEIGWQLFKYKRIRK